MDIKKKKTWSWREYGINLEEVSGEYDQKKLWRSQRINKNTVFLKSVSFLKETGTGANLFKYP